MKKILVLLVFACSTVLGMWKITVWGGTSKIKEYEHVTMFVFDKDIQCWAVYQGSLKSYFSGTFTAEQE